MRRVKGHWPHRKSAIVAHFHDAPLPGWKPPPISFLTISLRPLSTTWCAERPFSSCVPVISETRLRKISWGGGDLKASCCGQGLALCRGVQGCSWSHPSLWPPSLCWLPAFATAAVCRPLSLSDAHARGVRRTNSSCCPHRALQVQRTLQLGCFSSMKILTLCFLFFTDVSNRGVQTSQAAAKPAWWEHKTGRGPPDTCLAAKLLGLPRLQDGECDPLGVKEISQMTAKQVFVG